MAIETRTSRGSKVEESSDSKRTPAKPSSGSGTVTPSPSGLRRSERSLKKDSTPSPPSTRKSGRLEKQTPTPTPVKRNIGATVKTNTLSPLRRSDRSKKQSSPNSSVSKNSTSSTGSLTVNNTIKEKSMVQLTLETKEVSNCERELSKVKQRFSARAYKAFFKKQNKSTAEVESKSLPASKAISERPNDVSEIHEHLDPEDNILAEAIPDDNNSLSKRKRKEANLDAAHAMVSNKDVSNSLSIAVTLQDQSQENCLLDTCGGGLKRQRVNNEGKEQEPCSLNKQLNEDGPSLFEDNSGKEASLLMIKGASEPCVGNLQIILGLKVDGGQNACHACKREGKLLCCDGKGCERSYHLSCVHPPFLDVPFGVWHCPACTRKKLESGVHAVADGVESIWETSPNDLLMKKQFFVKYKGLAHVHNQWVPETQLLSETPSLVADFNQKNQVKWRNEWATPHRLLGKRPVVLPKQKRGDSEVLSCRHEWLVKWCGLDYEHVTWELESASFMNTGEVQSLMRDYEVRHEKANINHCSSEKNKKVAAAEGSLAKVSCLPAGLPPGLDSHHLDVVNNLRDYWHKGTNAVIVDDQERIVKVISFILSLTSTVTRPFIIITTPTALDSWDEDFTRFAGCLYTVVYNGNKDVRRRIRSLEFGEGDCVMFQVLITSLEVVMEDLDHLRSKKWEAVIVDECQRPKIHIHSEQIKALMTGMRVLLVNCELKDCILVEHLLSLLASHSASVINEWSVTNSSPKLGNVKEKLLKYIANSCKSDCKSDSSRFVEYWVPVEISCMQLEQYCATLLSNSLFLSASSKTDNVGALRDVLVATRKCCDHPNLMVDIPPPPPPAVDALDFGVKASGKLQLLDTMLIEIRNRGLRVLILFQSIGDSAKVKIGDILDDMVRQRFGENSYERVDGNVQSSRKHTALQNFNNEKQRFVFLLEARACTSSIKLTSVDVVIIFGSDWSPVNDIKNLQKITLDSQCEQIMTFRLYSCFTVEEKVLMLAREEKTRDTKLQNINRTTSHLLLKWGASYLFSKLHDFHSSDDQSFTNNSFTESSRSKDVVDNFFAILAQNGKENDASNSSILKVKQSHGNYICNSLLPGEKALQSIVDEELTHLFWKNLLEGKEPQWKYLSRPSQRSRKRVQYSDDLTKVVEVECDVVKRRKKTASCSAEPNSPKAVTMEGIIGRRKEASSGASQPSTNNGLGSLRSACNLPQVQESNAENCNEDASLHKSQNSLHCDLKPKIESLCEVLQLPDDVKGVVGSFLEYVMNNHNVSQESETILQAFQISLCWTAASMMKYKIDHKESLLLAKERLNFGCKKEEADYVYSMLRCLKKVFLYRAESVKIACSTKSSKLLSKCVSEEHASSSRSISSDPRKQKDGVHMLTASQEFITPSVLQQPLGLAHQDFSRSIKDINKKCDKQMKKLLEQQAKEKEDVLRSYEEGKAQLEHRQKTDAAVIRCHSHGSMRTEKLKSLEAEYAKKIEELEQKRVGALKNLEAMHAATRKKLEERKVKWVVGLESWAKEELMPRLPAKETGQTPGMAVSFNVHPKQVPEVKSMPDRQVPSDVCEIVSLSDDEEEINPMVESAAEVIPETALTMDVEISPVEVTAGTSASLGARVDEQGGGVLSAESERLVGDQLLKDNSSFCQVQAEESDVTGGEKAGVGATYSSHSAGADLQGELVSEVPERTKNSLVVDNAHREIGDCNITSIEKSKESVKHHGSLVPAELPNVCSEVADVNSTVAPAESIDKLHSCGVDSSTATPAEQQDRVSPDTAATNASDVGDLSTVINGASANILGKYLDNGSIVQDVAAPTPDHRDGCAELSRENLPTLTILTETCAAGDSVKIASSGEVNQQDPTGVSNMSIEVADGSRSLLGEDAAEVHNTTNIRNKHQSGDTVDSISAAAEGEVGGQDELVSGAHETTVATDVMVGLRVSLGEINDVAVAEILDNQLGESLGEINEACPEILDDQNDVASVEMLDNQVGESLSEVNVAATEISVHDVAPPITTSQDDNSQETLLSNSASVHDGVIPGVLDTDTRDFVNVGDSCRENNGSSAAVGQEGVSSEQGTPVGQHERTVISPVPETASTERMDVGNSCGEIGRVSTQLDNETVGFSVQDVSASRDLVNAGDSCRENNGSSVAVGQEGVSSEQGTAVGQHGRVVISPVPETASTERMDVGNSCGENGHVSTQLDNETVGFLVQDVSASRDLVNVGDSCRENNGSSVAVGQEGVSSEQGTAVGQHDGVVISPVPETASTDRMGVGNSCGENGRVSTQLDNETVGFSVQDVSASTSNRDGGSEENPLTNSTSIQQPEAAAAAAQVSQLFLNQLVQDEAVVQPAASTRANTSETPAASPSTSALGTRVLQVTPVYRVPLPLGHDPLQNELDRIRHETDHIVSVHEKEKLQLNSDCEKEIEEVVAQIRKKYEVRIKEKKAEFVLSKLELDANHKKILMNKILAEAFRSKCMDIRACNSPGVLQDAAATFMQQFQHMASQPTQAYPGHQSSTAAASSRPFPPPGTNRQTTLPSPVTTTSRAQAMVHNSTSRPLSSSLLRPLIINSMSSPATTGTITNHQMSGQIRAPAPHLQGPRPTLASMAAPAATATPNISPVMQSPIQHVSTVLPTLTVPPPPHQTEATNPALQNDVVCLSDDD